MGLIPGRGFRSALALAVPAAAIWAAASLPLHAQLLPLGVGDDIVPQLVPFTSPAAMAVHPEEGGFVVYQLPGLGQGNLRGRRFDADGAPIFSEIALNGSGDADGADVAYDGQGRFVAVWAADLDDEVPRAIYTRRVRVLDGTQAGAAVAVSPVDGADSRRDPHVACGAGGGCAVTWEESVGPELGRGRVLLRRLDATGSPVGAAVEVAAVAAGSNDTISASAVTVAADGTIAVLWVRTTWATDLLAFSQPFVRFLTAGGQPLTGAVPLDFAPALPQISTVVSGAWNDQGQLLASWEERPIAETESPIGEIHNRLVAADGELLSAVRTLDDSGAAPVVAWCGRNDHFATFFDRAPASEGARMVLQGLDGAGEKRGAQLPAGLGSLGTGSVLNPRIACDGRGLVWTLWKEPVSSTTADSHLRLLRFQSGEPFCDVPSFPFPPAPQRCGFVGAHERFVVYATFRDQNGVSSYAAPIGASSAAAFFAFYDAEYPELAVKMVDGSSLNDRNWFFYGALSDREYSISVYDRESGETRAYYNPLHQLASVGDTNAFPGTGSGFAGASARGDAPALETRAADCPNDPKILCLPAHGFRVTVHWRDFAGHEGDGTAVPLTSQGGWFWFFGPSNLELAVKVLDGRGVNGYFWVFYASLTNVEFTLRVLDEQGHLLKEYTNPSGGFASVADTAAF